MARSRKVFSVGMTAFLDILGFGDRVISAATDSDIKAVVADISLVQKNFEFKPKAKDNKELHASFDKTVLAFSDSVIVNVGFESAMTELSGTFDSVLNELSGFAFAQGKCVNEGLFLRGGVDIGWWHRRGDVLASSSLTNAYRLESRAVVPVIALTDMLYDFLSAHPERRFYAKDADPLKKLFRHYQSSGPKGPISFWYLDYVTLMAESTGWVTSGRQLNAVMAAPSDKRDSMREKGYVYNIESWFKLHAKQIRLAHKNALVETVRQKYEWLADYHNEIAPIFTTSKAALCKLKKK